MNVDDYIGHVEAAVDGIGAAARGHLDAAVEHCPEFDVAQLLVHTGGFAEFVGRLIRDRADWEPSGAWRRRSGAEVGPDPIAWHLHNGRALVDAMRRGEPDRRTSTWAGTRSFAFWYRRAAQELAVHWWDAAHACGADVAIDPALAVDGIDEYLFEFAPRFAPTFGGTGEALAFVAADGDAAFSIIADGDHVVASRGVAAADVTAEGGACDLLLFLWGRVDPSALAVRGRAELLSQWQERVRI